MLARYEICCSTDRVYVGGVECDPVGCGQDHVGDSELAALDQAWKRQDYRVHSRRDRGPQPDVAARLEPACGERGGDVFSSEALACRLCRHRICCRRLCGEPFC